VGKVVLLLVAIAQQSKVLLGAGEVIFDAAPDPLVIGMSSYPVAHDASDNLKRLFKRFHRFTSCPLTVFGQGIAASYFVLLAFLSASRTQLCSRLARARPSRLAIASIRFRSSSRNLRLTTRVGIGFLAVGITTNDTRHCVHSKTRVVVCSCFSYFSWGGCRCSAPIRQLLRDLVAPARRAVP